MGAGRLNIQGVSSDAVRFKKDQTTDIVALLNERFKESYFKVSIEKIGEVEWFVLRRNTLSVASDYIQPIIPCETAASVTFLETGLAVQLPYGFYPVMEDSGARLVKYNVGDGQQLHIYIPYDTYEDWGGVGDGRARIIGDYNRTKIIKTKDDKFYNIGEIRDDRKEKKASGTVDFYLLYPPDFDYARTFIEIPEPNFKWPDMRTDEQDVYIIIDDSGSTAGTTVGRKVERLFGDKPFVYTLFESKKNWVHLHYARTGREEVFEMKMPEEENDDPLQIEGPVKILKDSVTESLKEFYRPAGEDENIPIAFSRCLASLGGNHKLDGGENPNLFFVTDEESEIPKEWSGYLGGRAPLYVNRGANDSSHLVLGSKLNIPLLLAAQLFDSPTDDPSPEAVRQNKLISTIQKELTGELKAEVPTPEEYGKMAETAHEDVYGEELFRIELTRLALVTGKDAAQYTDFLVSIMKSDSFDYPVKKRAIFLLGLYCYRGETDIIDLLLNLRMEIKDKRLRMDLSQALSFTPNIARAKALLEIAKLDPNGVDMEEVISCGLNEYTVRTLSTVIRDGLKDAKERAIKVVDAFMIKGDDIEGLKKVLGSNYNRFITLYWRPEYIEELKSALIEIELLYNDEVKEIFQKLSMISLIMAPKVVWKERESFVLNRLNTSHYYVKVPYEEGMKRLGILRKKAETEESFLFIKKPGEEMFYETGDGETMGSANPLPPQTMMEIIKVKPDEIVEMHLHPGRYTGEMGIHDVASDADIVTSLLNSVLYKDIYNGTPYTHRIITPNGIFTIKPHDISIAELQDLFGGPTPKISGITNAYNKYIDKCVRESLLFDINTMRKILNKIADVDFELAPE